MQRSLSSGATFTIILQLLTRKEPFMVDPIFFSRPGATEKNNIPLVDFLSVLNFVKNYKATNSVITKKVYIA